MNDTIRATRVTAYTKICLSASIILILCVQVIAVSGVSAADSADQGSVLNAINQSIDDQDTERSNSESSDQEKKEVGIGIGIGIEVESSNIITADVDWFKEMERGGNTAIALIILFFAMIAFAVERAVRLRRSAIIPQQLVPEVKELWQQEKFDEIHNACHKHPSILSMMITYVVEHRHSNADLLIPGAGDIAARELRAHNQKANALAVVAALAPLLGLLGTMIGMIESFKLVEQYGDEGGASMLAGSISKALITTAVGLIIAIPSLVLYHFFKARCNNLGYELEKEMEILINAWLLKDATAVKDTVVPATAK